MPPKNPKVPVQNLWKKGQSGNPRGSSAKKRNDAAIKRLLPQLADVSPMLTADAYKTIIAGILMGTVGEIKENHRLLKDDVVVAYQTLATCISVCAKKGDVGGLLKLVEYVHGKAPERFEVTGKDGGPLQSTSVISTMTVDQIKTELAAVRARRKASEPPA